MSRVHNEFEELERELREGLALRPAPPGLSHRIMARIPTRRTFLGFSFVRWPAAAALSLSALFFIFAVGRFEYQRQQQQLAGERARDQVILALRITGSTLHAVQQKVQQSEKEAQP